MTQEPISHYCCVCGSRLPQMTGYDLVQCGAGKDLGDGQIIYFCAGGKHTEEDIVKAVNGVPAFRRASEGR